MNCDKIPIPHHVWHGFRPLGSVGQQLKTFNMYDSSGFKKLVIQYLEFLVAEDFGYDYELGHEVIFTENLVSKSVVIVPDFSQRIEEDIALRDYLSIIISNINLRLIKTEDMFRTLNQ